MQWQTRRKFNSSAARYSFIKKNKTAPKKYLAIFNQLSSSIKKFSTIDNCHFYDDRYQEEAYYIYRVYRLTFNSLLSQSKN